MTFDCLRIGEKTMKTLLTIVRSVVALVGVAGRNFLSVQFMKTDLNLVEYVDTTGMLSPNSFYRTSTD